MDEVRRNHKITIENREKITITGICDVENFDEREITLYTIDGAIQLFGEDFKINKLNVESGDVEIEGYIVEVKYTGADKTEKGGFWGKIFR